MKVHDLAKSLDTNVKGFIRFLGEVGIPVKSSSTKLDDDLVEEIKALYKGESKAEQEAVHEIQWRSDSITIQELLDASKLPIGDLMKSALKKGLLVNVNSEIDLPTAQGLLAEFDISIKNTSDGKANAVKDSINKIEEDEIFGDSDNLQTRPPVITIMGHVDHGKTLLLDTIRQSNIIQGEAGGITQHIGAYQVTKNGKKLTFLDTPGHAAFTALRARGAQVTDIVILVVAADEGAKPQTIEAIDHAKAAGVPIIVAINKMDKPDANPEKVKQDLSQHGLLGEDWGGDTIMVPISAKKNEGIDQLLEMLTLMADMNEYKADPDRNSRAIIIESHLSKQRGPIASVLVKSGTLKVSDHFLIDSQYGKVRAMLDDHGKNVKEALPGMPVQILGVTTVPSPGSVLEVFSTEKEAKKEAAERKSNEKAAQPRKSAFDNIQNQNEDTKFLNLLIKGDVNGSVEAIIASINELDFQEVAVQIIHSGTGDINENDVMLGVASNAIIIGFSVGVSAEAKRLSESEKVQIKHYSIIYEILDDIEKAINGLYVPEFEEIETGSIEVRQLFKFSKVGSIAGSYVTDGIVQRSSIVRVFRGKEELHEGKISTLKRFKDDVKEVKAGYECGIVLESFNDLAEGDIIKAYKLQEKNKI